MVKVEAGAQLGGMVVSWMEIIEIIRNGQTLDF